MLSLFFLGSIALAFVCSHQVENRATFSDSRSNFHTRVGYCTNVYRRRHASDCGRASDGTPAPKRSSSIAMTACPVPNLMLGPPIQPRSS